MATPIDNISNAAPTKITGDDEAHFAKVTPSKELGATDTVNTAVTSTTIPLTTTAVELKVGASRLADRKYIWMEALDNNVKWGFSATDTPFDIFKSQLLTFPIGNVAIYAKMTSGTGNIAFGEGA